MQQPKLWTDKQDDDEFEWANCILATIAEQERDAEPDTRVRSQVRLSDSLTPNPLNSSVP